MGHGPNRQRWRRQRYRFQAEHRRRRHCRLNQQPQPDGGAGEADRQGRERGGAKDKETPELLDRRGGAAGCRGARGGRRGPARQHLRVPCGVPHQVRACLACVPWSGRLFLPCCVRLQVHVGCNELHLPCEVPLVFADAVLNESALWVGVFSSSEATVQGDLFLQPVPCAFRSCPCGKRSGPNQASGGVAWGDR